MTDHSEGDTGGETPLTSQFQDINVVFLSKLFSNIQNIQYFDLFFFFLKYNLTDTSATGFFEVQYSTSQSPRSSVMIGSNCIPQCVCYMYMNSILEGTFFYSVQELYCGDIFQAILRLKIIFGVRIRIGDMLRSGLR